MDASQVASARCCGRIGRAAVLYSACSGRLLFARWPWWDSLRGAFSS